MSDLLNNGSNSLLAFQRALATTSHNIANLNTEGYSRQRIELEALAPSKTVNGFIGNGVRAAGVERLHDQFAMTQVLQSTGAHAQQNIQLTLAGRVDSLVAEDSLSLTPVLNDFFNALQDVNGNPSSSASREVFIESTRAISSRFTSLQSQLDNSQQEVNSRTNAATEEVNQLSKEIAEINLNIVSSGSRSVNTDQNDLLDKRDALLTQLSELVDVTRVDQDDGSISVFMGNGVGLVLGNQSNMLRTTANPLSSDLLRIEYSQGDSWQDVTTRIGGGTIGGLLEFESQTLKPAMNQLGLIALQFSSSLNTQHAKGVDLNGNLGTDIFSVAEPLVMANDKNAGSGSITSVFTDVTQVQATEYDIRYTGSDFAITRTSDQSQFNSSIPITIDGMQISIAGSPAAGDTFRVSPVRRAAATIESQLTNGNSLALSNPLRSSGNVDNASDASIGAPEIDNINNPALRDAIDIHFTSSTTFDLVDSNTGSVVSAGVAYTPNTAISYNGWQVEIDGVPQTDDVFSVLANSTATGNNENGLSLAAMQLSPEMTGGATFNEGYSALVSRVGGQARTLQTRTDALDNMRLNAIEQQQSISGVNLDEEAINLTRYEQAYQASAQIISTADVLFQTILGAVGR